MAAHRYWQLSSLQAAGRGVLTLHALALLSDAGSVLDTSVAPTASASPSSGSIANLRDGVATSQATWASASGLTLTWDFGGAPADVGNIRLGAVWPAQFLDRATLRYSDDGSTWTTLFQLYDIAYPGYLQTTTNREWLPPNERSGAVLLINGRGSHNSTKIHDLCGLPVRVGDGAKIITTDTDFPQGAISVSPGTASVFVPSSVGTFEFTDDFYIGFDVKATAPINDGSAAKVIIGMYDAYAANGGLGIFAHHVSFTGSTPRFMVAMNGTVPSEFYSASPGLVQGQKYRFELTRASGVMYAFVDGVLVGTYSHSGVLRVQSPSMRIGGPGDYLTTPTLYAFEGLIGRLKVVNGAALYTATHSVSSAYEGRSVVEMLSTSASGASDGSIPSLVVQPKPANALAGAPEAARSLRDFYQGGYGTGRGRIVATTKNKGMPLGAPNVPQREIVRLYRQRDGQKIAETWSNETTGAYSFLNIDETERYFVVSHDKEGLYRGVIADNLTPEIMP